MSVGTYRGRGLYRLGYEARRIVQTPKAFSNWPTLYSGLIRERVGVGSPASLTFEARSGRTITIPNAPGARVPPYEVFADDSYDLHWFLGDLLSRPIHVLDIGAHVGTFACRLTQEHPQATVDCFEPSPDTGQLLRRNVAGQRPHRPGHRAPGGGGRRDGHAAVPPRRGRQRAQPLAVFDETQDGATAVETISFDDVVARRPARSTSSRWTARAASTTSSTTRRPRAGASVQRLVLEYHAVDGQSWEELRAWFAAAGLHVVRQETATYPASAWPGCPAGRCADPAGRGPRTRLRQVAATRPAGCSRRRRRFSNWPSLLAGMVRERRRQRPGTLTFEHPLRHAASRRPTCPALASPPTSSSPKTATGLEGSSARPAPVDRSTPSTWAPTSARSPATSPSCTPRPRSPASSRRPTRPATCRQQHRGRTASRTASRSRRPPSPASPGWACSTTQGDASVHSSLVHDADAGAGRSSHEGAHPVASTRSWRRRPRRSSS